jgi:hypothetical protein
MSRGAFAVAVVALIAAGAGGCSSKGSYRLTWSFGPASAAVTSGLTGDGGTDDGGDAAVNGGSDAGDDAAVDASPDAAGLADASSDGAGDASGTPPAGDGGTEPAATACPAHGVFGIFVAGSDTGGDTDQVITPCTPGVLVRGVPPGTWALTVRGLDATGSFKAPADTLILNATVTGIVVSDGGAAAEVAVVLTPQPACSDGIDNDNDGRVDLDDPDCGGDPNRNAE